MSQRRSSVSNITNVDGVIVDKIDLLFEKRKAVRESALSCLHTTLSLRYCGDALEPRYETLADGLERVLKDQQLEPTLSALRTAVVTAISLRSGHTAFYTKLCDVFQRIVANTSMPTAIRSEAINTIGMTCFMNNVFDKSSNDNSTISALSFLSNIAFCQPSLPADVIRAALQSCILLGSTLPSNIRHQEMTKKHLSKIVTLMSDEQDILVRLTAAKAVTILIEWHKDYLGEEWEQEIEDLEDILEKMRTILDDKVKFKSKDEKKKQRKDLKSYISYLEEGEVEEEHLVVHGCSLDLTTWTQIFRMDQFRTYLGEGFMNHLEGNKNLMDLFGYYVDMNAPIIPKMSKQQRRLSLSETSKATTVARSTLRSIREAEVGYASE